MSKLRKALCAAAAIAAAALLAAWPAAAQVETDLVFRVVTFNVRFDWKSDGGNRWEPRKDLVAETILASGASVACIQEDKEDQIADLKEILPGWQFAGRGIHATGHGEHCSVAFDASKWRLVEAGDLWLSDEPEKPGSNTWGTPYPRKATWAFLEPSKGAKQRVLFVSTHFDSSPRLDHVREKSAACIRGWLEKRAEKANVVVCGDFNAGEEEAPHEILLGGGRDPRLVDAWTAAKPADPSPGTVHDFKGGRNRRRIDWILFGGRIVVRGAEVFRWNKDGRWPSDHYPVVAEMALVSSSSRRRR